MVEIFFRGTDTWSHHDVITWKRFPHCWPWIHRSNCKCIEAKTLNITWHARDWSEYDRWGLWYLLLIWFKLIPRKCGSECKSVNFKLIILKNSFGTRYEIAVWWMPENLAYVKSTLDQVMAWCRQATSHYLSQCWLRSISPYGVTRPQRGVTRPQGVNLDYREDILSLTGVYSNRHFS